MNNQLHVVASAVTTSGGEGLAAMRYAASICEAGCSVTLISKHISMEPHLEPVGIRCLELQAAPSRRNLLLELLAQYDYIHSLCEQKHIDLIHLHGMWCPFLAVAALVAKRKDIPLVISPHGCLEPWALGFKRYKKLLAMKIYQAPILRSASMFIATADQEANSIRRVGLRQPVAIIPNGVDVSVTLHRDANKEIRTILFLSRIHPIKGLFDLVEAWAIVRQSGWRLVIAGSDEAGHRAQVEALIRTKGLEDDFEFVGFVDGTRKQDCFDRADIFVLPTYSENFGIAIAEALSNELPVITTTGAPWQDLLDYDCGWWVEPGVPGISSALETAFECKPDKLKQMGKRGRQLVIEKYSWEKIGYAALNVSNWLLDQSLPKPEIVEEGRTC